MSVNVGFDNVIEREVGAHCAPGWTHNRTVDLHCEASVGEEIGVKDKTTNTADSFDETAPGERESVGPGAP